MAEVERTFSVNSRGVGLPDYSQSAPVGQVPVGPIYSSGDVAELAVRLGSPNSHDRRGNVIFWDSFENGFPRWRLVHLAGGTIELSTDRCRSGSTSLKMTPNDNDFVLADIFMPFPTLGLFGFETSFVWNEGIEQLAFSPSLQTGEINYKGSVSIRPSDHSIFIQGTELIDNTITLSPNNDYLFHTLKLVVNYLTGKFVRLILDSTEYDISRYDLITYASTASPQLNYVISVEVGGAVVFPLNHVEYIDDVIITQNEPPNT